jgi:hypothetical protein
MTSNQDNQVNSPFSPSKFILFTVGLWSIHWSVAQFYVVYCAPPDWWGFLKTPLLMGNPVCLAGSQILAKSSEIYVGIWIGAFVSLLSGVWSICYSLGGKNIRE